MGVSQNEGSFVWGPHNKDHGILGSILGSPFLGGNYQMQEKCKRKNKAWPTLCVPLASKEWRKLVRIVSLDKKSPVI